jgi:hypothetical protein
MTQNFTYVGCAGLVGEIPENPQARYTACRPSFESGTLRI